MSDPITSFGEPIVSLQGFMGNLVSTAPGVPIGTRPLAQLCSLGTMFVSEARYSGYVIVHPFNPLLRIWFSTVYSRTRNDATASGAGVTSGRLGVYVAGTGLFTQATVLGQFCNAQSLSTVGGGAVMTVNLVNTPQPVTGAGTGFTGTGQEFMTDATGLPIPYVPGVGVVSLGYVASPAIVGAAVVCQMYDW